MFTSLKARNVIVTGGTRGIGCGIAEVFASEGANIMISGRDEGRAKAVCEKLAEQGGAADCCIGDASDWNDVNRLMEMTEKKFGSPEILCLNAGIYPRKKLSDMKIEEWDEVMRVNLKSSFLAIKAVMPFFKKNKKGRIILISSITGPVTGVSGWAHYGASKAGQIGFVKSAAIELAPFNVTINAVMPGNIDVGDPGATEEGGLNDSAIPLGRLGTVEEIGHTVLFLASDEAAYITGQSIIVDGGQTLPEYVE